MNLTNTEPKNNGAKKESRPAYHCKRFAAFLPKRIAKRITANYKEYSNPSIRTLYGVICGVLGIFFNLVLFTAKLIIGVMSGSIAIIADAINNLSDASSSLIMIIGFRLSSQKPDNEHPFGHRRIEYITGLIVSFIIIMMGFELVQSSVKKIFEPTLPRFDIPVLVILVCSIIIKLFMFMYNAAIARRISSSVMRATATDSICDSVSTSAVLISMILAGTFSIAADGWCGLLVSGFIIFSGIRSIKDAISPLLGQPPSPTVIETIDTITGDFDDIIGIHDIIVHNYGPGVMFVTLHAEVPADGNLLELHETIDRIERRIEKELNCRAVIHMDPMLSDTEMTADVKTKLTQLVTCIDDRITIHDFRMIPSKKSICVSFDLDVPFDVEISDEVIVERAWKMLHVIDPTYRAVITVDRS